MQEHTSLSFRPQTAPAAANGDAASKEPSKQELSLDGFTRLPIQRKLIIGAVHDPLEAEADAVADKVMRMPEPNLLQRKCAHCEEEEKAQRKPLASFLQKKEISNTTVASAAVSNQVSATKGSGSTMDASTRTFMKTGFGTDFSKVRIHTDAVASRLSGQLNAQAFTVGNDIYFKAGKYAPESADGKHLLAHELTHTLQQTGAAKQIQRDLAIEPELPGAAGRTLTALDMRRAIEANRREFSDPYSVMLIRDVIGIPKYPAVINEEFVNGVVAWQAAHGITQDGIVGRITAMYVMEELQAEGLNREADLIRQEFEGGRTIDIDASLCSCKDELRRSIASSLRVRSFYGVCGSDPRVLTGPQVQQCVIDAIRAAGGTPRVAGTTSGSGQIAVARQAGTCGALLERITLAHEQIHQTHSRDIEQATGSRSGRPAFDAVFNDRTDWAGDEINAHTTDINVSRWALRILDRICP